MAVDLDQVASAPVTPFEGAGAAVATAPVSVAATPVLSQHPGDVSKTSILVDTVMRSNK